MRTLVVVRHGKSDWSGPEPDHDRPLAKRGRRQAPESGTWLAANLPDIDLAVVSTALRAHQTWELIAAELPSPPPVHLQGSAYAAWGSDLLEIVQALPEHKHTVALVGHNPGLEDLVETLTGKGLALPTSCLAVIRWRGSWTDAGLTPAEVAAHGRPPGSTMAG